MKQRIRLTEGQLNRVIKESVKRVLKEMEQPIYGYYVATLHWVKSYIIAFHFDNPYFFLIAARNSSASTP